MPPRSTEPQGSPPPDRAQRSKARRTRQSLLDAAAEVVRVDGVSGLTLDRVAATAGVSKGGLLYHFGTKQELVVALLDHTLRAADDSLTQMAANNGARPGSFATAYLDYVRSGDHRRSASAAGIFAAAALEEGDLGPAQNQFGAWQKRLLEDDGLEPTVALLARVVGDGLWLIDLFGLAPLDDAQRDAVCSLVESLLDP